MDEFNILADFIGKFPPHIDVKWGEGTADDDYCSSPLAMT